MLYPSINEIRKKADSRYTLAMLAAKRARDLIDGKPPLVEIDTDRPVSIAANEINDDYITYKRIDPDAEEESTEEETLELSPEEDSELEDIHIEGVDDSELEAAEEAASEDAEEAGEEAGDAGSDEASEEADPEKETE